VSRLRLLKVVTQATFVLDDGDTLREITTDPVTVSATDWPEFPVRQFVEATDALAEQLGAEVQGATARTQPPPS